MLKLRKKYITLNVLTNNISLIVIMAFNIIYLYQLQFRG